MYGSRHGKDGSHAPARVPCVSEPGDTVEAVKLTRDDWIEAAYRALLSGGPQAVAVAPLAERLGATRGSFYHYFDDRAALLDAALARWELVAVDSFIARASEHDDAAARLGRLFSDVFSDATVLTAGERHLLASRGDIPSVDAAVTRVTARRQAFVAGCYRDLGYDPEDARHRATVAYMVFTGWLYLEPLPDGSSSISPDRVAEIVTQLLISEPPASSAP